MPNEAQDYLTGQRTTPLTSHTFQPKSYAQRMSKSQNSSPEPEYRLTGVNGPHVARRIKISPTNTSPSPSSPTPTSQPVSPTTKGTVRGGDISNHRGSFIAEVYPTERDGTFGFNRMLSIHLHVTEEPVSINEAGEVTTSLKRWLSTDAVAAQKSDNTQTPPPPLPCNCDEQQQEHRSPKGASSTQSPNGSLVKAKSNSNEKKKKNKKRNGTVNGNPAEISEHGSVLNKDSGKRHVKKRWRIKRLFGIKN